MCDCPAHQNLVECVCLCDHTGDRMRQWRRRALAATRERNELRAKVNAVEHLAGILEVPDRSLAGRFMSPTWRAIATLIRAAIA